ncbi:MAG: hypothetical protein J1E81_07375 [Eubacterium sp.]|nr:hypothetical protein [Eubacterium sp.]
MTNKTQAQWYGKKFSCNAKSVNLIDGLSTSFEINEVTKTDKNGKSKTTIKGLKPQEVSFTISPLYEAGVNPRTEFESYKKLISKTGRLYIGGKAFGPYLMLTSASLSDVILDNFGNIHSCSIALSFKQSTKKKYKKDAKSLKAEQNRKKNKKPKNQKAKDAKKHTIQAGSKVRIVGSKYSDGKAVSKNEKSKTYKIKSISGSTATLSNGKKIKSTSLSLC